MDRDGAMRFILGGAGSGAGSEDFTILANGNVGIGTTTPGAKLNLHVNSSTVSGQYNSPGALLLSNQSGTGGVGGTILFGADLVSETELPENAQASISSCNTGSNSTGSVGNLNFNTKSSLASTVLVPRMTITNDGGISFGSTGTNYGTSGYVLTSAGNAPPTWQPAGGGASTITTNNSSGNGTVGPFALGATPSGGSTSFVDVFIDGVYQEISTYTVSGTALSFVTGSEPPTGTNIQTKTTSGTVSGALVSSVDIGQSSGDVGAVNLRINPIEVTSGTTELGVANSLYIFTSTTGSISTLTLPASPTLGDSIKISNIGGLANVIATSGTDKIMGQAGPMTINVTNAAFELIWSNIAAQGWIIIGNV
jgi:hypothetical protein